MVVRATFCTCSITFSSHKRSTRASKSGIAFSCHVVRATDVLHVAQPVVDQAVRVRFEGGADAAAAVMSADDDVLHLKHVDRKLEHRQAVEIGVDHEVGDVAVHEELAGIESDDLISWHAAVRAADPQKLRRLLARQAGKKRWVALDPIRGPGAIVVE